MALPETYYAPKEQATTGFKAYYDPLAELPLDAATEALIEKIGPRRYLAGMERHLDIKFSHPIDALTDLECHRACRQVIRGCSDYDGPEKRQ